MRFVYALVLSCILTVPALAQTPGDCETGRAQAELDVSDVRATLFNTGSLFFGQGTTDGTGYIVPKASGNSTVFALGLWTGGLVGGELRMAAATYDDFEFYPGPLLDGGALPDPDGCSAYDRIYVVTALDVEQYEATGFAPADLAGWPVGQGAPAVDAGGQPIVSSDIDRVLDLDAGERPVLSGSQTAFWVMNDVGNEHENLGTAPLGIEVAVTAFSILSDDDALDQATVYRYAITNKSPSPIEDFAVGFFSDPDLGGGADDMVGVDTTRALAFVYNASNTDSQYGTPPAFGYDLLSGEHRGAMYFESCGGGGNCDPQTATGYYNFTLGRWGDGVPVTEGGNGYFTSGPETTFPFPGDPVEEAFWSELNIDSNGTDSGAGTDRRHMTSVEPVTLAPGETRTVDLALVFAQGADHLDSITELRAASDRVQAAYDAGSLFAPGPAPTLLATPAPTAPADGAAFEGDAPVTLSWQAVSGAETYRVELSADPSFPTASTQAIDTEGTSYDAPTPFGEEVQTVYWRVRAEAPSARSFFSDTRSFSILNVAPDFRGEGRGIVEVARPEGPLCAAQDANDWGCARALGNTVWLDADTSGDYLVSVDSDFGNPIERLRAFVASLAPAAVEMRFTDGPHWAKRFNSSNIGEVWSVPFELWNVGPDPDDPSDDVRMIPFVLNDAGVDFTWADRFPREDPVTRLPATSRVYGMMPDRRNGYDLFAETAAAIGVGGEYVDTDVTDTVIDPDALLIGDVDPSTGEVCDNVGSYVSYCYRNAETSAVDGAEDAGDDFVQPLARVVLVDLAGDGTTPPVGTTIRFLTTDAGDFAVSDEAGPVASAAAELRPVRPNPSRGAAVVPFELAAAGPVRLRVLDALGREVAVLVDGVLPAGPHRAELAAGGLASGVYVVVLEAGGERLARTVTVTR